MAEIAIVGCDGNVTIAGHQAKLNRWSATISQIVSDTSAFQDSWAGKRGGMKSLRGSASGVPSSGAASTAPNGDTITKAAVAVVLTCNELGASDCELGFNAVVSSVDYSYDQRGAASVGFNFESDSTVTETWIEA